jgi:hypothetical protein
MEEHVKYLLPREILMILSSGVSVPLVDGTRRSTSAVKLAKAYVIPPKTEMAVRVKADREGLSLLKPLCHGKTVVCVQWCLVLTRS